MGQCLEKIEFISDQTKTNISEIQIDRPTYIIPIKS